MRAARRVTSPAMTPETPMKARLAAGETLFGTFLTLGSPLAAESLGLAGFDWLLVDLEHGGGDESQLLGQLLGASAAGVHALVRVESDVRGRTARALDLGVEGVMCPQVNSVEQAEAWASRAALRARGVARDRVLSPRRALRDRAGPDRPGARAHAGRRADRVARGGRGRRGDRRDRGHRRAVRRALGPLVLDGTSSGSSTIRASGRRSSASWRRRMRRGRRPGSS